jgi:Family of unknown function (DUF5681)
VFRERAGLHRRDPLAFSPSRGREGALGRAPLAEVSPTLAAELDTQTNLMLCENEAVSTVQNNGRTTGGVTGKGFMPGQSGNPRGRPKGLARATRELVGEDGMALVELCWDIARDETRRDRDRLEASRLLADRGWGKAPAYVAIEEDNPLGLEDVEAAAEEFRRRILRLAEREQEDSYPT